VGKRRQSRVRAVLAAFALGAAVGGTAYAAVHDAAPGELGAAPRAWPSDTSLAAPLERPVLLVFVHPRCPCTRATMTELARLAPRLDGRVDVRVAAYRPASSSSDWAEGRVLDVARSLRDVALIDDVAGTEARRFDALTSGTALLYSARGELLFRGGITPGRGHEGDSAGGDAIVRLAGAERHGGGGVVEARVFGCSLRDRTAGGGGIWGWN